LVVCNNDKFRDARKRNVTTRSEIWTTNIRSLGFKDSRECITLWRLILQSLGCNVIAMCNSEEWVTPIAHPHLLMRATSEWFLPAWSTFKHDLASESHWLQPMLVLTVHWWPTLVSVGGL
jgi:hypothetical protein